tara:strand:+ start:45 stop:626 length:582 start_codon:yes stop_codon:yes gene_type:complete
MASQSTSIADLPRTDGSASTEDIQESMMVNSILQDIENDEDLNDVNEDSLNYTIDTSQIPPKIGNELPSVETIQETTENIFNNDFSMDDNYPEPDSEPESNEIDDFLNTKLEETKEEAKKEEVELTILEKVEKQVPVLVVVVISFIILSLPKLNSIIVRFIPKLSSEGGISFVGILLKALIMGIIYLVSSIFM